MEIEARDLQTGRRLRATLLPGPGRGRATPGGEADRVPKHYDRRSYRGPFVPQRIASPPGSRSVQQAVAGILGRSVRALGRNPEAAAAAFLGGFAGLFAEAIQRRIGK